MNIGEFPISRQKVLLGAGLGLVTAVVAACSTYGKKPEAASESSPATAAPSASGGTAAPAAKAIAKTTDVPVGSGVIVGDIVVTQPTAGVFKGFSTLTARSPMALRTSRWRPRTSLCKVRRSSSADQSG